MKAYSDLLVATCHKRGAFAMGGMAAFIPTEGPDDQRGRPRQGARRQGARGDRRVRRVLGRAPGPGRRSAAEEFDAVLGERPNQLERQFPETVGRPPRTCSTSRPPAGRSPRPAYAGNVSVVAALPRRLAQRATARPRIDNLMEDAATVEISRSQLWQWIRHGTTTDSGVVISRDYVAGRAGARRATGSRPAWTRRCGPGLDQARDLFARVVLADDYLDFLTHPRLPGLRRVTQTQAGLRQISPPSRRSWRRRTRPWPSATPATRAPGSRSTRSTCRRTG